jgi:hypothetical protein
MAPTHRIVVLALVCVLSGACDQHSPASPSATGGGWPFQAGRYVVELTGDSDPCGDIKSPQAGTTVSFVVTLRAEGTGATGTTSSGGLVLHLRPSTSTGQLVGLPLAGAAEGFVDDEAASAPTGAGIQPNGTRATFLPAVPFSGGIPPGFGGDFSLGTMDGPVVFSRSSVTSTCPPGAVHWTMNRAVN